MKKLALSLVLASALTACETADVMAPAAGPGPDGAPAPGDPNQELVDLQGCRWWVAVTPEGMQWERVPGFRTDCDGEELPPANTAPPAQTEDLADAPEEFSSEAVTLSELERDKPAPDPTTALAPAPKAEAEAEPNAETEPQAQSAAAPQDASAPELSADGRGLYIQAATFRSLDNAQSTAADLRERGFPVLKINDNAGALTPLILGPFDTNAERRTVLANLRSSGFPDAYMKLR